MSKPLLIIIILIAIVVVFGFIALTPVIAPSSSISIEEATEVDENTSEFASLPKNNNLIAIGEQLPGTNVNAQALLLVEDGYVVIHEVTEEGLPGAIIGVSDPLVAGQYTGLEFTTESSLIEGENYMAMLHTNDGDSVFTAENDTPIVDDLGNVFFMRFGVSVDAVPTNPVLF